ncbi:MAG: helix-turn-helix transcriptional regulator [Candidatus Eremiobacteraeota bacterium]|nr:helix-turn-helix transcriptional regulator [Candidatus Eremiobacteraeota bacterium]
MIRNKKQLSTARMQLTHMEQARAQSQGESTAGRLGPEIFKAMIAGMDAQIEELRQEIAEYERLEREPAILVRSLEDLPEALIKARIARRLTQKELAAMLRLKPQQIQRYESTRYQSASLRRVLQVGEALGVRLDGELRATR